MPDVEELFREECARRGITVARNADGTFSAGVNGLSLTISLDNLRKDLATDGDVSRVAHFVNVIANVGRIPPWDEAKSGLRWQVEPHDMPLGEALHESISERMNRVWVRVSQGEGQIAWVTPHHLEEWGQTAEAVKTAAEENMDAILAAAEFKTKTVDGYRIGMLVTDKTAFQAALMQCKGVRAKVEAAMGWPVTVVMPSRDFASFWQDSSPELMNRFGGVVLKEFVEGAYPVTTETFELSDAGLEAFGRFEPPPKDAKRKRDKGDKN